MRAHSVLAEWHDLQSGGGQRLNDAFRNLSSFLGVHSMIRALSQSIADCRSNYRMHLMLIRHTVVQCLSSARLQGPGGEARGFTELAARH